MHNFDFIPHLGFLLYLRMHPHSIVASQRASACGDVLVLCRCSHSGESGSRRAPADTLQRPGTRQSARTACFISTGCDKELSCEESCH